MSPARKATAQQSARKPKLRVRRDAEPDAQAAGDFAPGEVNREREVPEPKRQSTGTGTYQSAYRAR